KGAPCELAFGAPEQAPHETDAFDQPLQKARAFFRLPRQELNLDIRGVTAPRNWQHVSILLDMDETWPSSLRLSPDTFSLHVVPIMNV
ncbi:hypothetical protein ACSTLC_23920, partial [Vibrio parahaemolyticus]